MSAQLVLQYHLDQFQTMANTISDISFDNLSFLSAQEPIYNLQGQKVSKSYFNDQGKEAVRIVYERIVGNYEYNGQVYENVFLGLSKKVHFFDWSGEIAFTKSLQPYYFNLFPVYVGDGTLAVIGFSSTKKVEILKNERYKANGALQALNPNLYAVLYGRYTESYDYYLATGKKENLVNAINSETDESIIEVLNIEVNGMEPLTVKELILNNLQ